MSIIVLLILFLIVIILGVVLYFIYYKKETSSQVSDQTKVLKECPIKFDINDYVFDTTPVKGTVVKEKFELSLTTIVDKSLLSEESLYKRGILKDEISNTIVPALNNGSVCLEYPKEIYIPAGYCDGYSDYSTGVSDDCYKELWKKAGCGGDPFNIPGKRDWNSQQTFQTLKGDASTWYYYGNIIKSPYHSQYCLPLNSAGYCEDYNEYSTGISDDCYKELWKNAGCGGDPFNIPGKREWNSQQTFETLKEDVNAWYYYGKVLKVPYHSQFCL